MKQYLTKVILEIMTQKDYLHFWQKDIHLSGLKNIQITKNNLGFLLIQILRRGGRVVEGARLESV